MKPKKLTKKDYDNMWGEDGPYSEVRLSEQTRILDNGISRVFLLVEASINPFTFEYVLKHRDKFADDSAIQELLDFAEYRGPLDGYVVFAGEEELIDKKSFEVAFAARNMTVKNVMKMHDFVMKECKLKGRDQKGIIISDTLTQASEDKRYIWDTSSGTVVPIDESMWDSKTRIESPAGARNGKIRYFIVFAIASGKVLSRDKVKWSASSIKDISRKFGVEIEKAEGGMGYMMLTALIGSDIAPADFVEACIFASNQNAALFKKKYFVTNTSRPTGNEIVAFLRNVEK